MRHFLPFPGPEKTSSSDVRRSKADFGGWTTCGLCCHMLGMVEALHWVSDLLTGTIAVSIAVLAVGLTGISMMRGRLPYRRAAKIVLGCFVVFGARLVAEGLAGLVGPQIEPEAPSVFVDQPPVFIAPDTTGRRNDLYPGAAVPDAGSSDR
jgi:type IV secretion system protein VirB2